MERLFVGEKGIHQDKVQLIQLIGSKHMLRQRPSLNKKAATSRAAFPFLLSYFNHLRDFTTIVVNDFKKEILAGRSNKKIALYCQAISLAILLRALFCFSLISCSQILKTCHPILRNSRETFLSRIILFSIF